MEENAMLFNPKDIMCEKCNEIMKIKIYYNRNDKSIGLSFECGHKELNQKPKFDNLNAYFCINCKKISSERKETINEKDKLAEDSHKTHRKIKEMDFLFYCKKHFKPFEGYCEVCKANLCPDCFCEHEEYKEKNEFYFTYFQINELSDYYEKAQDYLDIIYSIECRKKISEIFEFYYSIYSYGYNNDYFHFNIIYNVYLFYNYFEKCKEIGDIGSFVISEKTFNIKKGIFLDSDFINSYSDIIEKGDFTNYIKLFLLSKRMKIKLENFQILSSNVNSMLNSSIMSMIKINAKISAFNGYFFKFEKEKEKKENELELLKDKIKLETMFVKLSKITIPSNSKRKLINILQREIVRKYKEYLHKIKPNSAILNSIKRKYELIKKQKKIIYNNNIIEKKIEDINSIKIQDKSDNKENIYFEYNFEKRELFNTFLFFIQKLYYEKSNETHYSKYYPTNEIMVGIFNNGDASSDSQQNIIPNNELKLNGDSNKEINNNSNFMTKLNNNKTLSNDSSRKMNNDENDIIDNDSNIIGNNNINNNNSNYIINNKAQDDEYFNFLNEIKTIFKNCYSDIYVKDNVNFNDIVDALFKNDYLKIIDNNKNNDENEIEILIKKFIHEIENITIKHTKETIKMKKIYEKIKYEISLSKIKEIIDILSENRKYKSVMNKLKEKDEKNEMSLYEELIKKLIVAGGFDEKNAKLLCELIEYYLSNDLMDFINNIDLIQTYLTDYSKCLVEVRQMKELKEFINNIRNDIIEGQKSVELNNLDNIKNNFIKNYKLYLKNNEDKEFKEIINEIYNFIQKNELEDIISSVKKSFNNVNSKFFIDDSISILSFCWAIQNGHEDILD